MNNFLINVPTHPAFGVVTFLIGLWGGNYFALSRDRRKEFNERSESLFVDLSKHAEGIGAGVQVDAKTRLVIEPYIFPCKRGRFRNAVKDYNDAQNYMNGAYDAVTGGGLTRDEGKFEHYRYCAEKLLHFVKRK